MMIIPIVVTLVGIVTDVSDVQPEKALSPRVRGKINIGGTYDNNRDNN